MCVCVFMHGSVPLVTDVLCFSFVVNVGRSFVVQVEHAKVCEEYEDQMKELEEILSAGPAAMNISVEQLAKQVPYGSTYGT